MFTPVRSSLTWHHSSFHLPHVYTCETLLNITPFVLVSFCLSTCNSITYPLTLLVFLLQPLLPAHTPNFLPTTSVTFLPTLSSVFTSFPIYCHNRDIPPQPSHTYSCLLTVQTPPEQSLTPHEPIPGLHDPSTAFLKGCCTDVCLVSISEAVNTIPEQSDQLPMNPKHLESH